MVDAPKEEVVTSSEPVVSEAEHQEVVEMLKGHCLEVSCTIHGLPGSRRIKGKMAETIAKAVKGKKKSVRGSWSPFVSDHPAVSEFNTCKRAIEELRDSYTLMKSADVQKNDKGVTIQKGVRLIWDKDVSEFYKLFVSKAKALDLAVENVQRCLEQESKNAKGETVPSIKNYDREEAGDAWEDAAYPKDVRLTAGVSKERDRTTGEPILDEHGEPKYLIDFDEYHVSEKLPEMLRKRAIERLDNKMSSTVETAFSYFVADLNDSLTTFMAELVSRIRIYPPASHPAFKYCKEEAAEVVKVVDHAKNSNVPAGQVVVHLAYKGYADGEAHEPENLKRIPVKLGPMPIDEYMDKLRPKSTGEKKKISTSVIQGIIVKLENFRDKQGKILGVYGQKAIEGFNDLFNTLTKAKQFHMSNYDAADKLASKLKSNEEFREELAQDIADTITKLEDQVEVVKQVVKRRSVKKSLIGMV